MKYYTKVSLNIILLFVIAILSSFIPEMFPDFFGDWLCQGAYYSDPKNYSGRYGCDIFDIHNPTVHWAYRHYLWFVMGLVLFIIQVIRIINVANNINKNE